MPATGNRINRLIDLSGKTDLPSLAGVLSLARAVVSNDSGAMHLAAAVGAKVVAIFGATNEKRTAPLGSGADAPRPVDRLARGVLPAVHAARMPDRPSLYERNQRS